jgi:hypothetical protein
MEGLLRFELMVQPSGSGGTEEMDSNGGPEGDMPYRQIIKCIFCHISFVHNIIFHAITVLSRNISTRVTYKKRVAGLL